MTIFNKSLWNLIIAFIPICGLFLGTTTSGGGVQSRLVFKIIDHVNRKYETFFLYENMANYFARSDVGLSGFASYLRAIADGEVKKARKLINYMLLRQFEYLPQNVRLGRNFNRTNYYGVHNAIDNALHYERIVSIELDDIHRESDALTKFFMDKFLMQQATSLRDLSLLRSRLGTDNMTVFYIDQELQ